MRVGLDRGDVSLLTSATAVRSSLQDRGVSGTAMLDLARDHLSIFFTVHQVLMNVTNTYYVVVLLLRVV